jgi:acetyl-CoA C-acetyltransferase
MAQEVYIVGAARTPIGKFLGGLASLTAPELGAIAIRAAVKRSGIDPKEIDEVIMGNVVSAGIGQAPGRQAAIKAGIPPEVDAFTINKVCGSGLKAVALAAQAIKAGDAGVVVAGGLESMSNVPHYLKTGRSGVKFGDIKIVDGMIYDGLWCAFENQHMGVLGEFTAEKSSISRKDQDEFALKSHEKAVAAIQAGKFKAEIVPVEIPQKKGEPIRIDTDEGPRADTTLETLAKLKPAFKDGGTITAGNAPGLNDGAAALVVISQAKAEALGMKPLAKIVGYSSAHLEPKLLFYAPVLAVRNLMAKLGVTDINHFDLIEANEAFSSQALADGKELSWDWNRVNVHGGAVALGHPIGATGGRILTTLIYALKDRGLKKGLATLCLGGGGAVAMAIEIM